MAKYLKQGDTKFLGSSQVLHVELANPHRLSGAAVCQVNERWRTRQCRGIQEAKDRS
jgi:hypothetical protein